MQTPVSRVRGFGVPCVLGSQVPLSPDLFRPTIADLPPAQTTVRPSS
jgi:hypothetical protein